MRLGGWGMFGIIAALFAPPPVAAVEPMSGVAFMPKRHSFAAIHYRANGGYRSRGKQAKPRKRPNRLHISRRTRRQHRRRKAA